MITKYRANGCPVPQTTVERAARWNSDSVRIPKVNLLLTVPVRERQGTLAKDQLLGPAVASTISVEANPITVRLRSAFPDSEIASLPTVV
jgi:hypothetical protein